MLTLSWLNSFEEIEDHNDLDEYLQVPDVEMQRNCYEQDDDAGGRISVAAEVRLPSLPFWESWNFII